MKRIRRLQLPQVAIAAAIGAALLAVIGPITWKLPSESSGKAPKAARAVVKTAKAYLTKAKAPKDCSAFVQEVFRRHRMKLPRTAAEQSKLGEAVRELRPGDLVFFAGRVRSRRVGHVGIYAGGGSFIHVPNADTGVQLTSLQSETYRRRFLFARRIIL